MAKKFKILLAEDDDDLREIVSLIVSSRFDCEIFEVENGEVAIDTLNRTPGFDLVISDYNMPKINGGKLFQFVRAFRKDLPFLLMTSDMLEDHPEFNNQKLLGYSQKPFREEILTKEIGKLLSAVGQDVSQQPRFVYLTLATLEKINKIKHPLFIRLSDDKYVRILNSGIEFTSEESDRMRLKGIEGLFVQQEHFADFVAHFQNSMMQEMLFRDPPGTVKEQVALSQATQELIQGAMKSLGWSSQVEALATENIKMVQGFIKSNKELKDIFGGASIDDKNFSTTHSILLCMACTALAKEVPLDPPRAAEILALAAFFHDISLDEHHVRNEMRFVKGLEIKSGALNKSDLEITRLHPQVAAESLAAWKSCPESVLSIIKHHHERPDGKGFPGELTADDLDELTSAFIFAHDLVTEYIEQKNPQTLLAIIKERKDLYQTGHFAKLYRWFESSIN